MQIQLPDDAEALQYTQTGPYRFEQVFTSQSAECTGTERELLKAGKAYAYIQVDAHTRVTLSC